MSLRKWTIALMAVVILCLQPNSVQAQEDLRVEIDKIKAQLVEMEGLKAKLAELERRLDESQKTQREIKESQLANQPVVSTGAKGVTAKIDGRAFLGLVSTGRDGGFPDWSTDLSDAKLRISISPMKNLTLVNRFSTTGARADVDYLYLDYANAFGPGNKLVVGQHKIDFGQETLTADPAEGVVISNSAPNITNAATGVEFQLKSRREPAFPMTYTLGFMNGPRGVMARPTNALSWNAKVAMPLRQGASASVSYYDSGNLKGTNKSALTVADLADAPTGAASWRRTIWEADLRYNCGANGFRPIIPSESLPKFMLGAAYGRFQDNASGADDRAGGFWYIEGLYNLTERLYTGARYSIVKLDDNALANLAKSPVPVNAYRRTSLGLGYRLSPLTDLKTEYTLNRTSGGIAEPSLDQWGMGLATKF